MTCVSAERSVLTGRPRSWNLVGDPLAFVLSKNVDRREMSKSQRAMVASRLATLDRGRPVNAERSAFTQDEAA